MTRIPRTSCLGRCAILAFLWLAPTLFCRTASADDEQAIAGQFFQAGLAAYARHDFKAAARAFEEAEVHVPRAASMFNAGLAWEAAGEAPNAADAYAAALGTRELREEDARKAERQLGALERSLGILLIVSPEGAKVTVAHVTARAIPARVHVRPGSYDVRIEGPEGGRASKRVEVGAGVTIRVSVALVAPRTETGAIVSPAQRPAMSHRQGGRSRSAAWIALGAAGAAAAVAGIVGIEGLQARDVFERSGETSQRAHDEAVSYRTIANVGWGVAAALAGTGLVLALLPRAGETPPSTTAVVVRPGGFDLRLCF